MRHGLTQQRDLIQRNCELLKGWRAYALAPVEDEALGTLLYFKISFRNSDPIPADEIETFCEGLNLGYLPERTENEYGKTYHVYFKPTAVPQGPQFAMARVPAGAR